MTGRATEGVRMAEASGAVDDLKCTATWTIARHALYGNSLEPAAAGHDGADSERGHGPRGVGRNQRNERCHDRRECRRHGGPADSPSPRPFEHDHGGLGGLMAKQGEAAGSASIRSLRLRAVQGQSNPTEMNYTRHRNFPDGIYPDPHPNRSGFGKVCPWSDHHVSD